MRQQVAVDFLATMSGLLDRSTRPGPAQVRLELVVSGLVLVPPLVICLRERGGRRVRHGGDGGDQGDQFALPVAFAV